MKATNLKRKARRVSNTFGVKVFALIGVIVVLALDIFIIALKVGVLSDLNLPRWAILFFL